MEIAQVNERIKDRQLLTRLAAIFRLLARLSLGVTFILAPFRFRWTLQMRLVSPIFPDYTSLYLYLADLPFLLVLFFWLASLGFEPRRVSLRPALLTYSLAGLVAISAASSFISIDRVLSIYNSLRMFFLFGLYLYVINEVQSIKFIVGAAGVQVFIQSVVGVAQALHQHSLGLAGLQELPLDPASNGVSIVWTAGARALRAYGLTDHPNILGGCLAFALVLLVAGYLSAHSSWRPWLVGLIGLGGLALFLTFSRSAWLALIAAVALLGLSLVVLGLRGRLIALAGLCAGVLLFLIPFLWNDAPFLGSRLDLNGSYSAATPENQSINERSLLDSRAVQLIASHPLTGTGLATFPEAFLQQDPAYPFDYQPPHLVPLEIAAETGIPGVVIYLLVLVAPIVLLLLAIHSPKGNVNEAAPGTSSSAAHPKKKFLPSSLALLSWRGDDGATIQLAGATAGLIAIAIVSFLDYYPWLWNPGRLWQWLLWGLWGGIYMHVTSRRQLA